VSELDLRAGDADRDQAVATLRDHLIAGRLTLEEFVERVELAHDAKTLGELQQLQRDLPQQSATAPAPAPAPSERVRRRWLVAVMSGVDRRRRWRLGARTVVLAVMGGANLDLRQAELEAPHSEILIVALMGGASLIVPDGIAVEVDGFAFMGGKDVRVDQSRAAPGMPSVHIRVIAVMGGVSIRSRAGGRALALPVPPL
jgi:hypothetical protein